MKVNFLILLAATLVPLVVGFIWYSPKIGFGKAWMAATGMTEESAKGANMGLMFGLTILFSFFMAFVLQSFVIHQFPLFGLLSQQPDFKTAGSESSVLWEKMYGLYGNSFRTFKHGAFHGALMGIFFAMPIVAINALFERKSFKYVAINAGYFIVSLCLMGGVICAFS
jgi:hypothetical protein